MPRATSAFQVSLCLAFCFLVLPACGGGGGAPAIAPVPTFEIVSVTATPDTFDEGTAPTVSLTVTSSLEPDSSTWRQVAGPSVPLTADGSGGATADLAGLEVAVDVAFVFEVEVVRDGEVRTEQVTVVCNAMTISPVPAAPMQIGGSTKAAAYLETETASWALYNVGNRFSATMIGSLPGSEFDIYVPGYIHDIQLVTYQGGTYALLAMGTEGIAVVACADPTHMQLMHSVQVNYFQDGLTFAEGGGSILENEEIASVTAPIVALESDDTTLWIADEGYGIHRTALTNVIGLPDAFAPVLEPDGTLLIDHEVFTLQYAGERPWGGPHSLRLIENKLFAALGFLGMGIFDPVTLAQVGSYNLYTDASVREDWFIDMDVVDEVQPGYLDAFTGMPDYRQASFEILEVWKNDVDAPTPWADFDRYGKYYYNARDVDVATYPHPGGGTPTSIAYIAYGLGGLIAVDVTGFTEADAGDGFLVAAYLGQAPAVPAHGPDKPIGEQTQSLYPYFGAGMLKEAGAVAVEADGPYVFWTDHFAGLVAMQGGEDPASNWKGAAAPYDNDDPSLADGILGDHWPDYEFVFSYDMSPYDPLDHESLPAWMYADPSALVTGEVNGHGSVFLLLPGRAFEEGGGTDLLLAAGAGGLNFVDILSLTDGDMADRYEVLANFPSTNEIGAAADGSPTQAIAIGHTQGIAASSRYLYVADGPHGLTAWRIADDEGVPIDDIHVVGNTLQDEYPVTVGETTVYPATHAWGVVYDEASQSAFALCQSVGLRRVPVADIEAGLGTVGAPLLMQPQPTDLFEHNGDFGTVDGLQWQDHAYDVEIRGTLAYVADGSNGLTIYDVSKDPTDMASGFVVANIGAGSTRPPLGRATGISLWTDPTTARTYAFIAAGPRGIGVVDVTDLQNLAFVKVFEPIKIEDEKVGHADGRAVDVQVIGDVAYFSYSSFGVVAYAIADLIEPVPEGVDPLEIWKRSGEVLEYDHRPIALARFKLDWLEGYEGVDGEALYMTHTHIAGKRMFYVGYGAAGVAVIDWSDAAAPQLVEVVPTVHEATAVTIANGRLYIADHDGGVLVCR